MTGRRHGPEGADRGEQLAKAVAKVRQTETDTDSTLFARVAAVTAQLAEVGPQPGDIKVSAVSGVPGGWLACEGQEVSRATYADLYAAVGDTHGAGNGTTTFNVPDARGRTLVGAGTGTGLTTRALGAVFGAETHTLTSAQAPTILHNHAIPYRWGLGSSHNHQTNVDNGNTIGAEANQGAANYSSPTGRTDATGGAGSDPHNNMQPSLALRVFIKT